MYTLIKSYPLQLVFLVYADGDWYKPDIKVFYLFLKLYKSYDPVNWSKLCNFENNYLPGQLVIYI